MKVELRVVAPDGAEVHDGDHPVVDARGRIFVIRCPQHATKLERAQQAEGLSSVLGPGDVGFVLPHGYSLEVYRCDAVPEPDAA